jgi:outer membrane protein OmpA-like peptidoglycan-associated protein
MTYGFGYESEAFEAEEQLLEEILDRLDVQEGEGYESPVNEDRLGELLDRLELQETGGYLSELTPSKTPGPVTKSQSCPPSSSGAQPTEVLDQFDFAKDHLKPFHRGIVQRLARLVAASWTTQQPIHVIRVVGHTDPVGKEPFNRELGLRRARAVQSALEFSLALQRRVHWRARIMNVSTDVVITPSTEGSRDPVAPNTTPQGRACNRRVEVFLETPPPPPPLPPPQVPDLHPRKKCSLRDYPANCPPGGDPPPVPDPPKGPIRTGDTLPPLPPPPPSSSSRHVVRDWANRALSVLPGPVRKAIIDSGSEAALSQGLSALGVTGPYQDALGAVWRGLKQ